MNCGIFYESPLDRYMSKKHFFFASLMCPSISGPKASKKTCLRFAIFNLHIQATEHFLKRIKKIWRDRTKIALGKKMEMKVRGHIFFFMLN